MKTASYLWVVTLLVCGGALAESPYRDDVSPVVEPPRQEAPPDVVSPVIKQFQERYRSAGRPRIALFWNVELVDTLDDQVVKTTRTKTQSDDSENHLTKTTNEEAGAATLVDGETASATETVKTEATQRVSANVKRSTSLSERDIWKTETAFRAELRNAGVRLLDRNTIMRITALIAGTENTRAVEAKALVGKADLLMEVLTTEDPAAPLGWGFRVNVLDVHTGEERSSFYSEAMPVATTPARVSFKATSNGFEKVIQQPPMTVSDVGRALALNVMTEAGPGLATSK